jgi:hypothetical protein
MIQPRGCKVRNETATGSKKQLKACQILHLACRLRDVQLPSSSSASTPYWIMNLIQVFLPLFDNQNRRFDRQKFEAVEQTFVEQCGGFTA